MGTGQDCMYARLYATRRATHLTWSGHGHNCKLEPRVHVTAATRDSNVLDSTAADLPLETWMCTTHALSASVASESPSSTVLVVSQSAPDKRQPKL